MTDSEVRAAGIALWNSLSFGTGVPEGLRIDREAFKIAEAATAEIVKLKNSRLDPDGNPWTFWLQGLACAVLANLFLRPDAAEGLLLR